MEKTINRLYKVASLTILFGIILIQGSQVVTNTKLRDDVQGLKETIELQTLQIDSLKTKMNVMDEIHPIRKKNWKGATSSICKTGTFLGYLLTEPVDTSITITLKKALSCYCGPKAKINSLRRGYNPSSEHYHGNAVDLAWDTEVIEYLLSESGQEWLNKHGFIMYIEGQPGSKRVKQYAARPDSAEYVFFNPRATGDHIHLELT